MKIKIPDIKPKLIDDKKIKAPEFDIKVEDLDKREITMCACTASDDNPYQQSA